MTVFEDMSVELIDMMMLTASAKPANNARLSYDKMFLKNEQTSSFTPIKAEIDSKHGVVSLNSHDNITEDISEKDKRLLAYLIWHRHTSPFESLEFQFLIKCPIFVARQIFRHRTASYNEVSRRYTTEKMTFYPPVIRMRSDDKQGSDQQIIVGHAAEDVIRAATQVAVGTYYTLLEDGVAPEVARQVLPQNMMTTFTFKIDLHNLLHFLELRLDKHTQYETRLVARAIHEILRVKIPALIDVWEKYISMISSFKDANYENFKTSLNFSD